MDSLKTRPGPFWASVLVVAAVCSISTAAIIQAVIPQVVPTANKTASAGTIFQLAKSTTPGSAGQGLCDDGTGQATYTACNQAALGFSGTVTATTSNQFFPATGGGAAVSTEATVQQPFPAGTISNFYASISAAPGVGNTLTLTWRLAGSSQTLTCAIANPSTTCMDTTHSFSPTAGQLVDVLVTANTTLSALTVNFSAQFGASGSGGGGGGAFTQISKQTASGATASFTFSAIPGTFTNLLLVAQTRSDAAASQATFQLQFNGDTGANYDFINFTTAGTFTSLAQTSIGAGVMAAANTTANFAGVSETVIANYAGTTFEKGTVTTSGSRITTGPTLQTLLTFGDWRTTGTAITSITVSPSAGNFATGSTFVLYGEN